MRCFSCARNVKLGSRSACRWLRGIRNFQKLQLKLACVHICSAYFTTLATLDCISLQKKVSQSIKIYQKAARYCIIWAARSYLLTSLGSLKQKDDFAESILMVK